MSNGHPDIRHDEPDSRIAGAEWFADLYGRLGHDDSAAATVEIWCENSAVKDVLAPLNAYGAQLVNIRNKLAEPSKRRRR